MSRIVRCTATDSVGFVYDGLDHVNSFAGFESPIVSRIRSSSWRPLLHFGRADPLARFIQLSYELAMREESIQPLLGQ
jgi:hypothetical protein